MIPEHLEIYKRKLSEEENAGGKWACILFFRMKLRNLTQKTGNDGLYLHRFHNGVGTDK